MNGTIKANIAGIQYSIKGDNAELTHKAVQKLNEQIDTLKQKYKNEVSVSALPVIAALNIAEENILIHRQQNDLNQNIADEINLLVIKMNNEIEKIEKLF